MSNVARRCAQIARHVGSFVLHFAHGGIVMTGVLVLALLGYQVSLHGAAGLNPANLAALSPAEEAPVAAAVAAPELVVTAEGKLSPELTRVAQYIARRYKVSPVAVEPLLLTAVKAGKENGVDPLLILAVTSVESGFNPLAESVLGAQGLMQIIPRYHGDKISEDKGRMALFDPAENIRVGSRILKEYVRNRGSIEQALQQYGGAPNDADMIYANKVLTELDRLRQVMKFGTPKSVASEGTERAAAPAAASSSAAHAG